MRVFFILFLILNSTCLLASNIKNKEINKKEKFVNSKNHNEKHEHEKHEHGKHEHEKHEHEKHEHEKHEHEKSTKINIGTLGSHQHGLGKMNIVQDKNLLHVELEMPGIDVVGFEYKAYTKEDKKKIQLALVNLKNPSNIIEITNKADCILKDSKSVISEEKSHSEFIAEYKFSCKKIGNLKYFIINIFENFKNSKNISLSIIGRNSMKNMIIDKENKKVNVNNFK